MNLVAANEAHLATIMNWFNDEQSTKEWAGPQFPYPYDRTSFKHSLSLDKIASYALTNEDEVCVAFGQVYKRLGRCHLGRLAVSPEYRGTGVARILIDNLIKQGLELTHTKSASLFVVTHNFSAIRAYEKAGFRFSAYPGTIPYDNCLYMLKSE